MTIKPNFDKLLCETCNSTDVIMDIDEYVCNTCGSGSENCHCDEIAAQDRADRERNWDVLEEQQRRELSNNSQFSRDSYWTANSVDPKNPRTMKIRDMDDTHLVNVIDWVKRKPEHYPQELLNVLLEEVGIRGLSQNFVEMAPLSKERWGKSEREILLMDKKPIRSSDIISRRLSAIEENL